MSTEATLTSVRTAMHPVAARRILRLALGAALCLCASQLIGWPMAFVAPVLTLMILALPMPAPGLKGGLALVLGLVVPITLGLALVPLLLHARWAGILLVTLALFYSFYFSARGGSAALSTFMTLGLTLVVTIGSVNGELLVTLAEALAINAIFGVVFVWVAHALLPDIPTRNNPAMTQPAPPPKPSAPEARRKAFRSLLVVMPLVIAFLFISGSPAYTVVMIKVASLGQQASTDQTRAMSRSLLASTFWGGIGAIVCWNLLSAWPSLLLYVLLTGLAGLVFGRRIFHGAAVHPDFSKWSYAYLTLIVLLAPAVMDSPFSGDASSAFWWRLLLFGLIAAYGTAAVRVFDAFWPQQVAESADR
jgi:hypothetical protein